MRQNGELEHSWITFMDKFWLIAACAIFVGIFTIRDFRRTKRHADRNSGGLCGFCAEALGWSRHEVRYQYSRTGPPVRVRICEKCHGRRKVRRWLIWLIVFFTACIMVVVPMLYRP